MRLLLWGDRAYRDRGRVREIVQRAMIKTTARGNAMSVITGAERSGACSIVRQECARLEIPTEVLLIKAHDLEQIFHENNVGRVLVFHDGRDQATRAAIKSMRLHGVPIAVDLFDWKKAANNGVYGPRGSPR